MAQSKITELKTGSVAEVSQRLALWLRRSPKGFARVEYSSEFSRQQVMGKLQAQLQEQHIPLCEIQLLTYRSPDEVVGNLLEQLSQIPSGAVSITGFSTAFHHQTPLPDALRVLNFNRERLVALPLNQIWWMTPVFTQTSIHAMPDLNSWFSLRLQLTENLSLSQPPEFLSTEGSTANIDDTHQRVHYLLQGFERAKTEGATDEELLTTYVLPALEALAEVGSHQVLRDLTMQFEGLLGQLKRSDSANMATSLNKLANLYKEQGRYGEAEPLYLRSLAIYEQHLGIVPSRVATILNNLAELYRSMGRYEEAEPLYLQSIAIYQQNLENIRPYSVGLNNLAGLYYLTGRYEEAEPLLAKVLSIREQQLGANHPDTALALNNLAELYRLTGRYEEAEPLLVKALSIREQQLGVHHPDTAQSLNNLALLYASIGRYEEAERLYVRTLDICEQHLGIKHPSTALSLWNLARLYYKMSRFSEAKPLITRAIDILERTLGEQHPHTVSARTWWQTIHASDTTRE